MKFRTNKPFYLYKSWVVVLFTLPKKEKKKFQVIGEFISILVILAKLIESMPKWLIEVFLSSAVLRPLVLRITEVGKCGFKIHLFGQLTDSNTE